MSGEHAKKELVTREKPGSLERSIKTRLHQRRPRYPATSIKRTRKNLPVPSNHTRRRATIRKRR
jgi:hypothetical protein